MTSPIQTGTTVNAQQQTERPGPARSITSLRDPLSVKLVAEIEKVSAEVAKQEALGAPRETREALEKRRIELRATILSKADPKNEKAIREALDSASAEAYQKSLSTWRDAAHTAREVYRANYSGIVGLDDTQRVTRALSGLSKDQLTLASKAYLELRASGAIKAGKPTLEEEVRSTGILPKTRREMAKLLEGTDTPTNNRSATFQTRYPEAMSVADLTAKVVEPNHTAAQRRGITNAASKIGAAAEKVAYEIYKDAEKEILARPEYSSQKNITLGALRKEDRDRLTFLSNSVLDAAQHAVVDGRKVRTELWTGATTALTVGVGMVVGTALVGTTAVASGPLLAVGWLYLLGGKIISRRITTGDEGLGADIASTTIDMAGAKGFAVAHGILQKKGLAVVVESAAGKPAGELVATATLGFLGRVKAHVVGGGLIGTGLGYLDGAARSAYEVATDDKKYTVGEAISKVHSDGSKGAIVGLAMGTVLGSFGVGRRRPAVSANSVATPEGAVSGQIVQPPVDAAVAPRPIPVGESVVPVGVVNTTAAPRPVDPNARFAPPPPETVTQGATAGSGSAVTVETATAPVGSNVVVDAPVSSSNTAPAAPSVGATAKPSEGAAVGTNLGRPKLVLNDETATTLQRRYREYVSGEAFISPQTGLPAEELARVKALRDNLADELTKAAEQARSGGQRVGSIEITITKIRDGAPADLEDIRRLQRFGIRLGGASETVGDLRTAVGELQEVAARVRNEALLPEAKAALIKQRGALQTRVQKLQKELAEDLRSEGSPTPERAALIQELESGRLVKPERLQAVDRSVSTLPPKPSAAKPAASQPEVTQRNGSQDRTVSEPSPVSETTAPKSGSTTSLAQYQFDATAPWQTNLKTFIAALKAAKASGDDSALRPLRKEVEEQLLAAVNRAHPNVVADGPLALAIKRFANQSRSTDAPDYGADLQVLMNAASGGTAPRAAASLTPASTVSVEALADASQTTLNTSKEAVLAQARALQGELATSSGGEASEKIAKLIAEIGSVDNVDPGKLASLQKAIIQARSELILPQVSKTANRIALIEKALSNAEKAKLGDLEALVETKDVVFQFNTQLPKDGILPEAGFTEASSAFLSNSKDPKTLQGIVAALKKELSGEQVHLESLRAEAAEHGVTLPTAAKQSTAVSRQTVNRNSRADGDIKGLLADDLRDIAGRPITEGWRTSLVTRATVVAESVPNLPSEARKLLERVIGDVRSVAPGDLKRLADLLERTSERTQSGVARVSAEARASRPVAFNRGRLNLHPNGDPSGNPPLGSEPTGNGASWFDEIEVPGSKAGASSQTDPATGVVSSRINRSEGSPNDGPPIGPPGGPPNDPPRIVRQGPPMGEFSPAPPLTPPPSLAANPALNRVFNATENFLNELENLAAVNEALSRSRGTASLMLVQRRGVESLNNARQALASSIDEIYAKTPGDNPVLRTLSAQMQQIFGSVEEIAKHAGSPSKVDLLKNLQSRAQEVQELVVSSHQTRLPTRMSRLINPPAAAAGAVDVPAFWRSTESVVSSLDNLKLAQAMPEGPAKVVAVKAGQDNLLGQVEALRRQVTQLQTQTQSNNPTASSLAALVDKVGEFADGLLSGSGQKGFSAGYNSTLDQLDNLRRAVALNANVPLPRRLSRSLFHTARVPGSIDTQGFWVDTERLVQVLDNFQGAEGLQDKVLRAKEIDRSRQEIQKALANIQERVIGIRERTASGDPAVAALSSSTSALRNSVESLLASGGNQNTAERILSVFDQIDQLRGSVVAHTDMKLQPRVVSNQAAPAHVGIVERIRMTVETPVYNVVARATSIFRRNKANEIFFGDLPADFHPEVTQESWEKMLKGVRSALRDGRILDNNKVKNLLTEQLNAVKGAARDRDTGDAALSYGTRVLERNRADGRSPDGTLVSGERITEVIDPSTLQPEVARARAIQNIVDLNLNSSLSHEARTALLDEAQRRVVMYTSARPMARRGIAAQYINLSDGGATAVDGGIFSGSSSGRAFMNNARRNHDSDLESEGLARVDRRLRNPFGTVTGNDAIKVAGFDHARNAILGTRVVGGLGLIGGAVAYAGSETVVVSSDKTTSDPVSPADSVAKQQADSIAATPNIDGEEASTPTPQQEAVTRENERRAAVLSMFNSPPGGESNGVAAFQELAGEVSPLILGTIMSRYLNSSEMTFGENGAITLPGRLVPIAPSAEIRGEQDAVAQNIGNAVRALGLTEQARGAAPSDDAIVRKIATEFLYFEEKRYQAKNQEYLPENAKRALIDQIVKDYRDGLSNLGIVPTSSTNRQENENNQVSSIRGLDETDRRIFGSLSFPAAPTVG